MLDHEPNGSGSGLEPGHESTADSSATTPRRRRAASRPAGQPKAEAGAVGSGTTQNGAAGDSTAQSGATESAAEAAPAAKRARATKKNAATKSAAKRVGKKAAAVAEPVAKAAESVTAAEPVAIKPAATKSVATKPAATEQVAAEAAAPDAPAKKTARKTTTRRRSRGGESVAAEAVSEVTPESAEPAQARTAAEAPTNATETATETGQSPAQPATRARRTRKRATAPTQRAAAELAPPATDPELVEAAEEDAETAAIEAAAIEAAWGADDTASDNTASDDTASEDDELDGTGLDEDEDAFALSRPSAPAAPLRPGTLIFQAPVVAEPARRTRSATAPQTQPKSSTAPTSPTAGAGADEPQQPAATSAGSGADEEEHGTERESRRRRRRRGRNDQQAEAVAAAGPAADESDAEDGDDDGAALSGEQSADGSSRRRRRRRRRQTAEDLAAGGTQSDDPPNTVVKIREPRERRGGRAAEPDSIRTGDDVLGVRGSVRLAAKQQRRRDGRSTRSRRAPIVSEAEFLARRESVERIMVVRQSANRTQIGVLEDGVLVEHYVNRESSVSYVGNVYLGKVQNVLPSMEAAFVDINKGRNAVLYAGEVDFAAAGLEGQPKRIESALKSGQPVLVQVTKDPIGHKGARLTSQISLPGRFLVYVPGGSMMGISRKLPDNERTRLKQILKRVVPEDGGVIVRTAAEGASEEELARDVERLIAQWEEIERRSRTANAPALLYGEPDLTVRVIRDIFNEDFSKLLVSGDEAYKTIHEYLSGVAPELAERLNHWTSDTDVFNVYRVDEQLAKALDRKVWLPSGGSLVIDRTEAMVVIDVNTGKFTGQGSNSLEETVTRNNLEAAEEIVRQLRLRDLGGIIVIDFIDMVLESNRELVLRRLLECLGRDRTKHQVAEVTSLGLVQMTRKRVGQGLLEAFSETCDHCNGRGIIVHMDPVEPHGRKSVERSVSIVDHTDDHDEHAGGDVHAHGASTHHVGSAAESRANRRRRRKGKHHESEDMAATPMDSMNSDWSLEAHEPGTAAEASVPAAPINLKAHVDDPDAVAATGDELSNALIDTGRPRKRRRAASRPAGTPQSAAEQSAAEAS
ncbi:MAG TPA: Rne/Rng family ribonuclease [Actinocrinis sp.]|uniref:Rne/Rng family ribonuclease n=1 Tax=Actinocrinis sp. TaxID=1920516 RepID=UPI002DDD0582|nr:Rne/Rng family ribonuclease [Actinocrinis sp.]HEV2345181.1 Rne/Rng family ribonuclease [Actinocrinis sp.]